MPSLLTNGGLSARALGHVGGNLRKVITKVFNSSESWPCPAGVTMLLSAVGKGSNGTAGSVTTTYAAVTIIEYVSFGTSPAGGNLLWEHVQGRAAPVAVDVNADGSATFYQAIARVWPDGSNEVSNSSSLLITDAVPGSASVSSTDGWSSSGSISEYGTEGVTYDYVAGAQAGAAASGFSKSFPGGEVGSPAPTTSFANIAVVPGTPYPVNVPLGGSITIQYYA